jgi:hypothetical protein
LQIADWRTLLNSSFFNPRSKFLAALPANGGKPFLEKFAHEEPRSRVKKT